MGKVAEWNSVQYKGPLFKGLFPNSNSLLFEKNNNMQQASQTSIVKSKWFTMGIGFPQTKF